MLDAAVSISVFVWVEEIGAVGLAGRNAALTAVGLGVSAVNESVDILSHNEGAVVKEVLLGTVATTADAARHHVAPFSAMSVAGPLAVEPELVEVVTR